MSVAETMVLYPYQVADGQWVFDDPGHGLKAEPFVRGADDAISRMVAAKRIPDAGMGFRMAFSGGEFPGYDVVVEWTGPGEHSGNFYAGTIAGEPMTLWLCPALGHYFQPAPRRIYVSAEPLPAGVDPIWHDGGRGFRHVEG